MHRHALLLTPTDRFLTMAVRVACRRLRTNLEPLQTASISCLQDAHKHAPFGTSGCPLSTRQPMTSADTGFAVSRDGMVGWYWEVREAENQEWQEHRPVASSRRSCLAPAWQILDGTDGGRLGVEHALSAARLAACSRDLRDRARNPAQHQRLELCHMGSAIAPEEVDARASGTP